MIRDVLAFLGVLFLLVLIDGYVRDSEATEVITDVYEGLKYDQIMVYSYPPEEKCECYCFEDID